MPVAMLLGLDRGGTGCIVVCFWLGYVAAGGWMQMEMEMDKNKKRAAAIGARAPLIFRAEAVHP